MKIFLDSGDFLVMERYVDQVDGFTTNPTLARNAGVVDFKQFANMVLTVTKGKPVSLEVFADDLENMERQAREIHSWAENIYVKIPCTNSQGESTAQIIRHLGQDGIKLNVTAVMTLEQINTLSRCLSYSPAILSIFCGRIADTGRDPVPFITRACAVKAHSTQILWASTREVLNIKQAQAAGCDIITVSPDLLKKMDLFDKDLAEYSLETVRQFHQDGQGWTL